MRMVLMAMAMGMMAAVMTGEGAPPAAKKTKSVRVKPLTEEIRQAQGLAPFYKKYANANGLPVVASEKVSNEAMGEAVFLVNQMLKNREDIRQALIANRVRVAVMAPTEKTTDIPEHSDLTPKEYWDGMRGLGATASRPAISCAEEHLLKLKSDRYGRENIFVHSFAHTILALGLNQLDPTFQGRLRATYESAMEKGLWKGVFSSSDERQYWANGVQAYFDCNAVNEKQNIDVSTREKLAAYDVGLFKLVDEAFRKTNWSYEPYDKRNAAP